MRLATKRTWLAALPLTAVLAGAMLAALFLAFTPQVARAADADARAAGRQPAS